MGDKITPQTSDLVGKLTTQCGPRTAAPMWPRPLLTDGEWAVYTSLWSFAAWGGDGSFPTHQRLGDRAWVERGTAANAVRRFDELGLVAREERQRADGSDTSNTYTLVEICPPVLAARIAELVAAREAEQAARRQKRRATNRVSRARTAATRRRGDAAEDSPVENPQVAGLEDAPDQGPEGGALHDVPPSDGRGVHHTMYPGGTSCDVPRGTSHDVPVELSSFDLPSYDQPPPNPVRPGAANACDADPTGGEDSREGTPEKTPPVDRRAQFAAELVATCPGWALTDTVDVIRELVEVRRMDRAEVAAILRQAAVGKFGATQSPRRFLKWWPRAETTTGPAPIRAGQVPGDRLRCPKHVGELDGHCSACKGEEIAATGPATQPTTVTTTTTAAAAAAVARAAARDAANRVGLKHRTASRFPAAAGGATR